MALVRLLCGTQRSGRAAYVDAMMRERRGRALLLVPTRQYAARRLESIAENGVLGRAVLTFDDFAAQLLRMEGRDPTPLRDFERRLLMDRVIERVRREGGFAGFEAIADANGFRAHVLRVITQLKQAAIEPALFRERVVRHRRRGPIDSVVAACYAAYQAMLVDSGAYDVPGLFWEADVVCRAGLPAILRDARTVTLDGFDDFTPSEFRLLESLAPHLDTLVFGLCYDTDPNRADLFALAARTARTIQERFGILYESFEESPPARFTEFAASTIFWRDPPRLPEVLEVDLDVTACPDFIQEIEIIGRRVKSLVLDEHVPVNRIAIVYRDLGEAAPVIRSAFEEFGIPVRMMQDPPLAQSGIAAFLAAFFDAIETWAHESVVETLTSTWFGNTMGFVDTVPLLARVAQIVSGREEWRARTESLIRRFDTKAGEDIEALLARMPHAPEAARAMLARIDALDGLARTLPAKAASQDFAEAVDRLLDALDVEASVSRITVESIRESEGSAILALRNLLGEWMLWSGQDSTPQSRSEFTGTLRQAMQQTTFSVRQPRHGVACMDAQSARHLQFDYVFFAGANEGAVPRPPLANAIYSEEDIESLNEAGIAIEGRRAHSDREAALFGHILNAARTRLSISWSKLSRRGQEQFPSPYVRDTLDLFSGALAQRNVPHLHGLVPRPHEAASWRDLRNAALVWEPRIQAMFEEGLAPVRRGADIETRRHDRTPFDSYDGVIEDPRLVASLAERFGPAHQFSVNQIETYKACPFRFFVERVLALESVDVPVAEFDPRVRGTLVHAVLQAFHEHYVGRAAAEIPEEEARETMRTLAQQVFDDKAWRSTNAPRGVNAVERERLAAVLDRYLSIEYGLAETEWKPAHFEVSFGRAHGEASDALSRSEPYLLGTDAGEVAFAGRIDRIDESEGGMRIVDYKSGAPPAKKDILEGRSLQLAIYALALEEFLETGTMCVEAQFVQVGRAKRLEALGRGEKSVAWPEREQLARDVVASCVRAIRAGQFPPSPDDNACAYCPGRSVCRYEPGRIEAKEARP